jgi:hypothetical protein
MVARQRQQFIHCTNIVAGTPSIVNPPPSIFFTLLPKGNSWPNRPQGHQDPRKEWYEPAPATPWGLAAVFQTRRRPRVVKQRECPRRPAERPSPLRPLPAKPCAFAKGLSLSISKGAIFSLLVRRLMACPEVRCASRSDGEKSRQPLGTKASAGEPLGEGWERRPLGGRSARVLDGATRTVRFAANL